jgi:uncharacterized membrane protein YeaQ/YmgE (transglycosylase-associated protein family)
VIARPGTGLRLKPKEIKKMNIITWMLLGLIAGIFAKMIMPGKDGGGMIITSLLGVAGAFVGGYIGSFFGIGSVGGLGITSILTATAGALLLLFLYRQFSNSGKGGNPP